MEALILDIFKAFWGAFGLWDWVWTWFEPIWPLAWSIMRIVAILVPLILGVAYLPYFERKVIAYMHVRIGPSATVAALPAAMRTQSSGAPSSAHTVSSMLATPIAARTRSPGASPSLARAGPARTSRTAASPPT